MGHQGGRLESSYAGCPVHAVQSILIRITASAVHMCHLVVHDNAYKKVHLARPLHRIHQHQTLNTR